MNRKKSESSFKVFLNIAFLMLSVVFAQQSADSTKVKTVTSTKSKGCSLYPLFNPGDALRIIVYPDTTVFPNGIYIIDGNGCVDFPIIGLVKVSGKKEAEVEQLVKVKFIDHLRFPNVQVRPLIRASCLGGFYTPGLYYIDPRASMWNLIQIAGGTQRQDGIKKLQWERDGEIYKKDLIPYYQSGQSLRDIGFKSGDQISVTPRPDRTAWEMILQDVLPILTFTIGAVATSLTAYQTYLLIDELNSESN